MNVTLQASGILSMKYEIHKPAKNTIHQNKIFILQIFLNSPSTIIHNKQNIIQPAAGVSIKVFRNEAGGTDLYRAWLEEKLSNNFGSKAATSNIGIFHWKNCSDSYTNIVGRN